MLQPGDHVGRYEIQAIIGEGGFGKVYRAYDPKLERTVAVKELLGERKSADPSQYAEHLARFRLEYRVQSQFKHPHIVAVYDLVEQDDNEYLIVELMDGGTLRDLIEHDGTLSPQRAVQIGSELCQAIAAIWARDIVHRDVKPNNILLTADGHAKLSDFGVAQVGQLSQRTQSDSHHPGTPAYMSPEQEKGYGYLDERSDLYSLGMVLYEALTGKSYKRERVPPRQLNPGIPKTLDEAIGRMLEREPDRRYQNAADLETALRRALEKPRSIGPWLAGGAIILALLIGGGLFLSAQSIRTTPTPTASPTMTVAPSSTPTVNTSTSTATATAIAATSTPTPSLTSVPATATRAPTRSPTPIGTLAAPLLLYPRAGSTVNGSRLELQWQGQLPGADYGYRVNISHESGDPTYTSRILDTEQWVVELPASRVGAWRWFVEIVRRTGTSQVVSRSADSVFYHDPFASPLATPAP